MIKLSSNSINLPLHLSKRDQMNSIQVTACGSFGVNLKSKTSLLYLDIKESTALLIRGEFAPVYLAKISLPPLLFSYLLLFSLEVAALQ